MGCGSSFLAGSLKCSVPENSNYDQFKNRFIRRYIHLSGSM